MIQFWEEVVAFANHARKIQDKEDAEHHKNWWQPKLPSYAGFLCLMEKAFGGLSPGLLD